MKKKNDNKNNLLILFNKTFYIIEINNRNFSRSFLLSCFRQISYNWELTKKQLIKSTYHT